AFLGFRAVEGTGSFVSGGLWISLLLAAAGVITAVPLVWFSHGVNRLKLSTMGLLQYLAPTCQFLLAVTLYGEAFTPAHGVVFASIWISLALYTADAIAKQRAPRMEPATRAA
ncbi:MAG TPA: hypothetical protein VFV33_13390, partial [Gemmatimonadaceae bacterium]|nr:hypothetical protein [Gemmatimonadaceae bacterium]